MSSINYVTDLLGLKDNNIILSENISKSLFLNKTYLKAYMTPSV